MLKPTAPGAHAWRYTAVVNTGDIHMPDEIANIILERLTLVLQRISDVEQAQQLMQADIQNLANTQREQTYGLLAKVDSLRAYMQNRDGAALRQRDQLDSITRRADSFDAFREDMEARFAEIEALLKKQS
jgi:hypothetical protein